MTRNAAGEGELPEQTVQTIGIPTDIGIDLAVGTFQIGIGDDTGTAMAGSANVNDTEIEGTDGPIEVSVNKVEPGRRAPMSEQARFDVLWPQRFPQQRIIQQINLTDGQIVGSAPVAVQQVQVVGIRQLIVRACRCHLDPSGPAWVSTRSKAD